MKLHEIRSVAVIGAGTMGAGIALCFAQAGYRVVLYDTQQRQLDSALSRIAASQSTLIAEGIISEKVANTAIDRIETSMDLEESTRNVEFVLEAAPEKIELKHQLFEAFEKTCSRQAILASNTSGLSITEIASVCRHPDRVAGMHWVNPPELVPLVEVIRGERSSDPTIELIYALSEKLGKTPVVIQKEVPGIGLNRLQFALLREALYMVESGIVSAADLDRIVKYGLGYRYPWIGPFETADLGGLDIFYSIATYLFQSLSNEGSPPKLLKKLVKQNHLGIKTGRGFYDYSNVSAKSILQSRNRYFIRQGKLIRELLQESAASDVISLNQNNF